MSEKILKKLVCSNCWDYFKSKYTNEELLEKYPYDANKRGLRNRMNKNKIIRAKRNLVCPTCGDTKRISKRLLMKISLDSYKREKDKND